MGITLKISLGSKKKPTTWPNEIDLTERRGNFIQVGITRLRERKRGNPIFIGGHEGGWGIVETDDSL